MRPMGFSVFSFQFPLYFLVGISLRHQVPVEFGDVLLGDWSMALGPFADSSLEVVSILLGCDVF